MVSVQLVPQFVAAHGEYVRYVLHRPHIRQTQIQDCIPTPGLEHLSIYYLGRNLSGVDLLMAFVYRDRRGVEYESVPLSTHEVTDPVPIEARLVSKRAARKVMLVYDGNDGAILATQPRHHRRRWTDEQWRAFEEHRRREDDESKGTSPLASVVVVKSERDR